MTLTQLAEKHNIDPVAFRLAVQEWIDAQRVIAAIKIPEGRNIDNGLQHGCSLTFGRNSEYVQNALYLISRPSLD